MIFSQILIKAGLRASPKIMRGKYCVLFAESISCNDKRNVHTNNISSTADSPFPLTIRQVKVSVKVTSMER